jgi:putative DNA primase/helicase
VVVLDNVSILNSAALSSCLTQRTIRDRLVGSSKIAEADNSCLWIATGNNPDPSDEVARRTVSIRLDARMEHPDQRTKFKYPDLKKWIAEQRNELMWAALVPIKAWVDKGMIPWTERKLGGFWVWAEVMGGILEGFGLPGFLSDTIQFRRNADRSSIVLASFVDGWWGQYQGKRVTASQLVHLAIDSGLLPGGEGSTAMQISKFLAEHQDQIVGGLRICRSGLSQGQRNWRLQRDSEVDMEDVGDVVLGEYPTLN